MSSDKPSLFVVPGDQATVPEQTEVKVTYDFQRAASEQGHRFAVDCDELLKREGFELRGSANLTDIGVEIDQVAVSGRTGREIWFEYKGSVQGSRPGLMRTDTLKKAIANGALLNGLGERPPYVVLASHTPERGAGLAMLETAKQLGYFHDVVCLYNVTDTARLRKL
jgi:hypothetical protein